MVEPNIDGHRAILQRIAKRVMAERGMETDFSQDVYKQLDAVKETATPAQGIKDMTGMLWCSIDNDDSEDLDQLTVIDARVDGTAVIYIAVADVDATAPKGTAIDLHAAKNTTLHYISEI